MPVLVAVLKSASRKSVPWGILVRDVVLHAFCGDLFSKSDQILYKFSGHHKCLLNFWINFKGLFSFVISNNTHMSPEPLIFPGCLNVHCALSALQRNMRNKKAMAKFTEIKRNVFIKLGRMQITPRLITEVSVITLEIFAKDNI